MPSIKSFDSEIINYHVLSEPENITQNLVIVPGFGGDVNFYEAFVSQLKRSLPNLRVYLISPRGHAFSSKNFPEELSQIEDVHTQDLHAFIKQLNLTNFSLLGHSYGGVILQNYLNLNQVPQPKIFFLISSTPVMMGFSIIKKYAYRLLTKWPKRTKPFAYKKPDFYKKFSTSWDIDFRRWLHDTDITGGVITWFLHFLAATAWKNNNFNKMMEKNGLYVIGKKDIIIPIPIQKMYLQNINQNKIKIINSGHIAPITEPNLLASIITKKLNI